MAAAVAATIALTACSGKSEASREQINNGREQAKEMLRKTGEQPATDAQPAPAEEAQPALGQ